MLAPIIGCVLRSLESGSSAPARGQGVCARVVATYSTLVGRVRRRRYHHSASLARHHARGHHRLRTTVT